MINLFLFVGVFSVVTLLVAFAAAFVLLLLQKWGVIEYVQVHGNDFFSEMFQCNFCLSWWTGCFRCLICYNVRGGLFPFNPRIFNRINT